MNQSQLNHLGYIWIDFLQNFPCCRAPAQADLQVFPLSGPSAGAHFYSWGGRSSFSASYFPWEVPPSQMKIAWVVSQSGKPLCFCSPISSRSHWADGGQSCDYKNISNFQFLVKFNLQGFRPFIIYQDLYQSTFYVVEEFVELYQFDLSLFIQQPVSLVFIY